MNKKLSISIIVIIIIVLLFFAVRKDTPDEIVTINNSVPAQTASVGTTSVSVLSQNLDTPWEVIVLANNELLISERGGSLKIVGSTTRSVVIPNVAETGEGGLMGLALHPQYQSNKWLYVYLTTRKNGNLINQVLRYTFDGKTLSNQKVIIDNIPSEANHNGGRIAFGPDGYLYVTTGDAQNPSQAQDTKSLAGKILRVASDGSVPKDNPFGNLVYSYGHRNSQGIAWDSYGNLWSTEHGRSGINSGFDELNLIEKGANYGWPTIQGGETKEGMRAPVLHSGATTTWAPAAITFVNGKLFFVGLRGQALYEVPVTGNKQIGALKEHFKSQFGRLRVIKAVGDTLYFGSSNKDGRGTAKNADDKIMSIKAW